MHGCCASLLCHKNWKSSAGNSQFNTSYGEQCMRKNFIATKPIHMGNVPAEVGNAFSHF